MLVDLDGNEVEPDPADGSHLVINCTSGEHGRADTIEDREVLTTHLEERSELQSARAEEEALAERREHARLQVVAKRKAERAAAALEELKALAGAGDPTADLFLRVLGHDV